MIIFIWIGPVPLIPILQIPPTQIEDLRRSQSACASQPADAKCRWESFLGTFLCLWHVFGAQGLASEVPEKTCDTKIWLVHDVLQGSKEPLIPLKTCFCHFPSPLFDMYMTASCLHPTWIICLWQHCACTQPNWYTCGSILLVPNPNDVFMTASCLHPAWTCPGLRRPKTSALCQAHSANWWCSSYLTLCKLWRCLCPGSSLHMVRALLSSNHASVVFAAPLSKA